MKLLIRAPMSDDKLQELKNHFDEVVYSPWTNTGERYYEDEMLKVLCEVRPDILITELDKITEKVLSGYPQLQVIGDCRAMPANIDIEACNRHKIPVLCTPGRNAQAVAEMLVGLLLTYMRRIIPSVQWVKDGEWKEGTTPYYTWMGNELYGKDIGFVGFGAVGKASAKLLEAFGCNISFYDPYVDYVKDTYKKKTLEEIFEQSDIVTVHLPVTEATLNIIDKNLLEKMKKNAIFINTARSAVINQKDLMETIKNHSVAGVIADVLENEPPTQEELEMIAYDWVLLTPHICGATYEVTNHQSDIIVERLLKWKNKENLEAILFNKKILEEE